MDVYLSAVNRCVGFIFCGLLFVHAAETVRILTFRMPFKLFCYYLKARTLVTDKLSR